MFNKSLWPTSVAIEIFQNSFNFNSFEPFSKFSVKRASSMQNSENQQNEVNHYDLTSTFSFKEPLNSQLNLLPSSQQQVNRISIKLDRKSKLSLDSSQIESRLNSISSGPICRICFAKDNLVSIPCDCSGSIGYVHKACLKIWIRVLRKRLLNGNGN